MTDFSITDIPQDECFALLDQARFGRLAMSMHDQPDIFPVNFLVDDGRVLIRTAAGTKLFELTLNNSVALEADEVSDTEAWSVVLKGTARVVDSYNEQNTLDEKQLETWLPSSKPVYITIEASGISGRRFHREANAKAEEIDPSAF